MLIWNYIDNMILLKRQFGFTSVSNTDYFGSENNYLWWILVLFILDN